MCIGPNVSPSICPLSLWSFLWMILRIYCLIVMRCKSRTKIIHSYFFFLQIVTSCNSTFRSRWWFSYGFCICNANDDARWCMEKKRSPDLLPNDPKTHRSLAGWRGRWLNTTLTRSEFGNQETQVVVMEGRVQCLCLVILLIRHFYHLAVLT